MPSDLVLLTDFANRNGNPSPYTTFASDHDDNYSALVAYATQVTAELRTLGGRNAPLGGDAVLTEANAVGRVGEHSGLITAEDTTSVTVDDGVVFVGAGRIAFVGSQVFATGLPVGSGTLYLAVDNSGLLTWNGTPGTQALDLYSRPGWNGTVFAASPSAVAVAAILPDGDEQELARTVSGDNVASYPALTYNQIVERLEAIELVTNRPRIGSRRTAVQNFATATPTNILFTATDDWNVGITHSTADQHQIVVEGLYAGFGVIVFDEDTAGGSPGTGLRTVEITVNGTPVETLIVVPHGTGLDTSVYVVFEEELAVSDIVRVRATHTMGFNMDVIGHFRMHRLERLV